MSIIYNGKEYGATQVINYSAAPDYNRGIIIDNILTGNYKTNDNGFIIIQVKSEQSNPTKISIIRSKTPIINEGIEIASHVIQQYQYSETLTAQVMAHEYYKLIIEGVGNPQIISCMFYPYTSSIPMKLTENITTDQIIGLGDLALKDNITSNDILGPILTNKGGTGRTDIFNYQNTMRHVWNKDLFPFYTNSSMTTEQWLRKLQREYLPSLGFDQYQGVSFTVWFSELADLPDSFIGTIYASVNPNSDSVSVFAKRAYHNELYLYTLNRPKDGWVKYYNNTIKITTTKQKVNNIEYDCLWKEIEQDGKRILQGSISSNSSISSSNSSSNGSRLAYISYLKKIKIYNIQISAATSAATAASAAASSAATAASAAASSAATAASAAATAAATATAADLLIFFDIYNGNILYYNIYVEGEIL